MRKTINQKLQLNESQISDIQFDLKSRDDIPQLLMGLQYIYVNKELRKEVFNVLETMTPEKVDIKNGRPGMDLWRIFVFGTLRVNLNWDYDRLHEMANNHKTIRQMLGHVISDDEHAYKLQTLKDNVALLTPGISDKISQLTVKVGHTFCKKKRREIKGKVGTVHKQQFYCETLRLFAHI